MLRINPPYAKQGRPRLTRQWRKAVKALRRYPGQARAAMVQQWKDSGSISDPRQLLSIFHQYDNWRI